MQIVSKGYLYSQKGEKMLQAEWLLPRVLKLGRQIGLPEEVLRRVAEEDNWKMIFKEAGAHSWDEHYRIHDSHIPELKSLPLIAPGAEIAVISKGDDRQYYILVQVRNNGETDESKKEIGVPGGASNMWGYKPDGAETENVVLEHPEITAYREFAEEVGKDLPYPIYYLCNVTTTNHYNKFPDAYASSVYYYTEVPWSFMKELAVAPGSHEGKLKVIPIEDLPNYKWFPDAEEAFELLMEMYS